jgi:hypothetical protein
MPTTETPPPQAVDYSGRPLTEGDTVAFVAHDPLSLCEGRIRIIGPNDLCIDTGDHLVTFPALPRSAMGLPLLQPWGGTAKRREVPDGAQRYPHIALQPNQGGA